MFIPQTSKLHPYLTISYDILMLPTPATLVLPMEKRLINVKELLADIRAGMDDAALEQKYQLSAQQLKSTFEELVKNGSLQAAELYNREPAAKKQPTTEVKQAHEARTVEIDRKWLDLINPFHPKTSVYWPLISHIVQIGIGVLIIFAIFWSWSSPKPLQRHDAVNITVNQDQQRLETMATWLEANENNLQDFDWLRAQIKFLELKCKVTEEYTSIRDPVLRAYLENQNKDDERWLDMFRRESTGVDTMPGPIGDIVRSLRIESGGGFAAYMDGSDYDFSDLRSEAEFRKFLEDKGHRLPPRKPPVRFPVD